MTTALDIAQTYTVATAVMVVALVAIAAYVWLGMLRARSSAAVQAQYRALVEQAADASRDTAAELKAVREELAEVKQRLAGLERLLSQIG